MNEFPVEQELSAAAPPRRPRRRALASISGLLLVGTIAAACGSGSGSGSPPAAGGGSSGVTVEAKTTSLGMVLTNSKGFTLYRLNKDSMNHSVCDSACQQIWPPLLLTGGGSPVAGSGVSGLGTIMVAAGEQVTYHGMPLYTFTGDSSAGQTNGQNVTDQWGTWFAITTQAAPAGGGSTTTTTSGGGGGPAF